MPSAPSACGCPLSGRNLNKQMNDIGIGAVGAAIIAGLVSLLGLIIGKEQKVSEFRQAWIDDLRKCIIAYLACINAISDTIRLKKSGDPIGNAKLLESYKQLNEASHGITLRINPNEAASKDLKKHMDRFEDMAGDNLKLTPDNIRAIEKDFLDSSKRLLKFEWDRVKRGEDTFVWTKYAVISATIAMIAVFVWLWIDRGNHDGRQSSNSAPQSTQQVSTNFICASINLPAAMPAKGPERGTKVAPSPRPQPKTIATCPSGATTATSR